MSEIAFQSFGGSGDVIHFAHANGFPPKTYSSLLNKLTENYQVIAMDLQPLWPKSDYQSFKNWETSGDDLIRFLDEQNLKGIIGIGHSFGGISTAIAAFKRPDLFKKIVLIEPVVLPDWVYYLTKFTPKVLLKHINPVVKKTLARTENWKSREACFEKFRAKKVFSLIPNKELWDYVNAGTFQMNDGSFQLRFSKEWEAQIYMTFISPWRYIDSIQIPYLVLRGETSDTITDETWNKWKARNKTGELFEMKNFGHLVPLEAPDQVAGHIQNFLS